MRIFERKAPAEVLAADTQLIAFDAKMSEAMTSGIATIWQVQRNAERLRQVGAALGAETVDSSTSLIEQASAILTSKELEELSEREELDPKHVDKFLFAASSELPPHDAVARDALAKMGYLAMLSDAEEATISKIDEKWQAEYAARIVGQRVLIWKPLNWGYFTGDGRYDAPYSSAGHGFTNMNINSGTVVTGTVANISLRKNGTITLADGINSYDHGRTMTAAMPPRQIDPEEAKDWNKFSWFQASEIFQPRHDSDDVVPKIKIASV